MAEQIVGERLTVNLCANLSEFKASLAKVEMAAKRNPRIAREILAIDPESLFSLKVPDGLTENGEMVVHILPTAKLKRLLARADKAVA